MDRGDTGAAVNLLERAEALLPPQGINLPLQESLIRGLGESGRFDITTALALADQVDALAATSDDPRDPGDAALNRAELSYLTGDQALASKALGQAIRHYKRKGATAYITRAQRLGATWASRSSAATPAQPRWNPRLR